MAFTLQQQQDIIYYLGWPGKTIIVGSTHYNSVIASRLTNLNAPIEAQANTLVTRIQEIDTQLRTGARTRASTLEVQDIKLNPNEIHLLRAERKKLISELSDVLDIDPNNSGTSSVSMIS